MSTGTMQTKIWMIGANGEGEFGVGDHEPRLELTELTKSNIHHIHCSTLCTIYSDKKYQNIWIAGQSNLEETRSSILSPITYFKQNSIELKEM